MNDPDDQAVLPPLDQLYGADAGLDPATLDSLLAVATDPSTPDPGIDPGLEDLTGDEDVDLADLGDPDRPAGPGDFDDPGDDELDLPPLDDEVAPMDDHYPGGSSDSADPDHCAEHLDPGELDDPLADL